MFRRTYRWCFTDAGQFFFQVITQPDPLFRAPIDVVAKECAAHQREVSRNYFNRNSEDVPELPKQWWEIIVEERDKKKMKESQNKAEQKEMLEAFDRQSLVGTYLLVKAALKESTAGATASAQEPRHVEESKLVQDGLNPMTEAPATRKKSKKSKKKNKRKGKKLPLQNNDKSHSETQHCNPCGTDDSKSANGKPANAEKYSECESTFDGPGYANNASNQSAESSVIHSSNSRGAPNTVVSGVESPHADLSKRNTTIDELEIFSSVTHEGIPPELSLGLLEEDGKGVIHNSCEPEQKISPSSSRAWLQSKGKTKSAQSKSMTQLELNSYNKTQNRPVEDLKRFTMEDSPPSLEEARARRIEERENAKRDRSDSIQLLRHRTSSRSSAQIPSAIEFHSQFEDIDSLMEAVVSQSPSCQEATEQLNLGREDRKVAYQASNSSDTLTTERSNIPPKVDSRNPVISNEFALYESEFPVLDHPGKQGQSDDSAAKSDKGIQHMTGSEKHWRKKDDKVIVRSGAKGDGLGRKQPKTDIHFLTAVPLDLFTFGKPERIRRAAKGTPVSSGTLQNLLIADATRAKRIASGQPVENQKQEDEKTPKSPPRRMTAYPIDAETKEEIPNSENTARKVVDRSFNITEPNKLEIYECKGKQDSEVQNEPTRNAKNDTKNKQNKHASAQACQTEPITQAQLPPPDLLDRVVWHDERANPNSPKYMEDDRLRWYRHWEAEGHSVRIFSELKHICAKEGCNAPLFDEGHPRHRQPLLCYGCGPHSSTRYCSVEHLLEDSTHHAILCGLCPLPFPTDGYTMPDYMCGYHSFIHNKHGWVSREYNRQRAFNAYKVNCDYAIFNDVAESQRQGTEFHGSTTAQVLVYWNEDDPKKDRFNRLLNIAFYDHTIEGPAEYLYRCLRFTLREANKWSATVEKELDRQFLFEFRALTANFPEQDFPLDDRHWEQAGLEKLCAEVEAKVWLLRSWRRYHPNVTDWIARAQGVGFPGTTETDKRQRNQGRIWNGWGFEHSEVPGTPSFIGFLNDGSI
ncbi:hypothetical protein L228DRAFT_250242 [Xylona heveae TC161]|uniref:Uncharacterized protein n=1 Tax=Xylona heveae (strain CBS 132557 / TC161) TaxID=1328760 RepID=A0A165A1C5_XYLHT|nr:hypothetical protein L228DRAFT_250242 [Xylona heveae TC161]KZF19816.1 hypothetical protein L228DRAFT_250242 [Xylona heveae TC161]